MHRPPSFLDIVKKAKDWTLPTRCTLPKHQTHPPGIDDEDGEAFEVVDYELSSQHSRPQSGRHLRHATFETRKTKMGGKSNKFDYSNRSSTGSKLGQIIGHALEKEAIKLQKAAEKELEKSRKRSNGSSTNTSDDTVHLHVVDLQAPDKDLGDDGLCALADGLEAALNSGTRLAIEDLNLSGNQLTTASLARLAPVISLAKHDLKTLNLANNNIKVETDEEASQWEQFIQSFSECFRLRRLDLRDNLELGSRAMEILARLHTRERKIDPIPADWSASVLSLPTQVGAEDLQADDTELDGDYSSLSGLSKGQLLKNRRGIRSIPYLELTNIGLDDAGALWLSYVVQDHYYPTQLIDGLNATAAASAIPTYQQDHGVAGLSWDGSAASTMGKDARMLLKKTEVLRYKIMLEEQSGYADSLFDDEEYSRKQDSSLNGKQSFEYMQRLPHVRVRDRTGSIRSIRTNDGGEHEITELESLRRKLQRHIIDHDGVRSVELWHAALATVACSRFFECFMLCDEAAPSFTSLPKQTKRTSPAPSEDSASTKTSQRSTDNLRAASPPRRGNGSYAKKLVVNRNRAASNSELTIDEVTNRPTTPKMVFRTHRKGVDERLSALTLRDTNPERFIDYQKKRLATSIDAEPALACRNGRTLPASIVNRILACTCPHEQLSALSLQQTTAAWQWGQDRTTLTTEMEWRKHDRSSQVWMLLEKIGCLAYEET